MSFYTFLPTLLNMSLTAGVAILFVMLLRLLLRRAPKVISYALWAVVLFRLLCPVAVNSELSLFNLFDAPTVQSDVAGSSMEYVPVDIVHRSNPEVSIPVPGVSEAINEALPQGEEQRRADPLEGPVFIATYVWMASVLAMAAYSAVTYIRLKRNLLASVPLRDNIYLSDGIASPFVMGLVRPKIYLPSSLEEREQDYIILHEQHHIKRLDHIIKALAFAALCVHWFNPLVWLAFVLAGKDMEMSCDEAVIKKLGESVRADYSASLLSLATGKRIIAGAPLAFGEGDTKGRIRNLANWRKPAFWVVLVSVLACIALAVGLLTNPAEDDVGSKEDGYYLRIGAEGVTQIEVSTPNTSGGAIHADGSPFEPGEEVWLEMLDGITDLRGVTVTAMNKDGEILYALSIPEGATDGEIVNIVGGDGWLLAPADAGESSSIGIIGGADGPTTIFVSGGYHFGVTIERNGGVRGENLPNLAFHPLEDENPAYSHGLTAEQLADIPLIPYTYPNNREVTISYTIYSGVNAPENIMLTDTAIGPDGSFLYVDENGQPIGQDAKFTREKILGGERFTCTLEPSQFNLAYSSPGPHETFRCFSLCYQIDGQWMEACFVLHTAEEYVNAAAGTDVAVEPGPVPPSRTEPAKVAEAFLTQYFDKMCAGDSDLNWDEERNAWLDGLIVYNGLNRNDTHLLSQWIGYKNMLADFGYRVEEDCGSFLFLDLYEVIEPEETAAMEDAVLRGYFKTTAFGTFIELGMVKKADGDYAIVSVSLPDWEEYNAFCEDFIAYMEEHELTGYAKTIYVDSERRQRQEALQEVLGINSYEWLDIVTADVDGSGDRKHVIAYAEGHDGGYMDGSRPITVVSLSMDRREKAVMCTLAGWTGYEAHLVSLPTPDGGPDTLCLSQWLGGTMEQYRIGVLQKGAGGSWRDTFAQYGMGLDYSIDLLSIREARLTYTLPDGQRGEAMLDPSIGYENALNMGQINEDGSLTDRGRMNEPETYSYTFGDGFTYRLYWEDGALSLHARQYIRGFHKLDHIGYLNSLWRYQGGNWTVSAQVEPTVPPMETPVAENIITSEAAAARYVESEALFENRAPWYDGNHRVTGDWDGDGKEDSVGFKDEKRREFTVELSGSGTQSIRRIDTDMWHNGLVTEDSPWGWEYYFDSGDVNGDGADELLFAIDTGAQGGAGAFCLLVCPTDGRGTDAFTQIEDGLDYRLYWEGETDSVRIECEDTGYQERVLDSSLILPYMGTAEEAASRIEWMEQWPDDPESISDDVSGFVITEDGHIVTRQYVTTPGGSHAEMYGYMHTEYVYGQNGQLQVPRSWFVHMPLG